MEKNTCRLERLPRESVDLPVLRKHMDVAPGDMA